MSFVVIFGGIIVGLLINKIFVSIKYADNSAPYNPPPQLWINKKTNTWETKEGSQRVAWWRTFFNRLFEI